MSKAETAQSSLTVIFKLAISGLTSIILVALGTDNLQFWKALVRTSLQSVLRIVTVHVLGPEVLLEKEMSTHSSFLAWEIPWTEEPGGLQSMGSKRVRYDLLTKQQQHTYIIHHKYVSLPRKP